MPTRIGARGARALSRWGGEARAVLLIAGLTLAATLCGVSLCPFATLTGIPCPGCGILRAMLALLRGHVAESVHIHPLALVAVTAATFALRHLRHLPPTTPRSETWLGAGMAAVVVAMLGLWVARFGGAFGGPVSVNSVWSATGSQSPFQWALTRRAPGEDAPLRR